MLDDEGHQVTQNNKFLTDDRAGKLVDLYLGQESLRFYQGAVSNQVQMHVVSASRGFGRTTKSFPRTGGSLSLLYTNFPLLFRFQPRPLPFPSLNLRNQLPPWAALEDPSTESPCQAPSSLRSRLSSYRQAVRTASSVISSQWQFSVIWFTCIPVSLLEWEPGPSPENITSELSWKDQQKLAGEQRRKGSKQCFYTHIHLCKKSMKAHGLFALR